MPVILLDDKKNKATTAREHRSSKVLYPRSNTKFKNYIKPMLAKLHDEPFDDPEWIFEIKWDGYRAIAEINKKDTRLYSRNGLSFKEAYPVIFEELKKIKNSI